MSVTVCRTTHESVLRQHAAKVLGCERLALMSDKDVRTWLDGEGYQSYVEYTGEYDDSDDILIAKPSDIEDAGLRRQGVLGDEERKEMNGYDMMCDLVDYLGEWAVLDALAKYLPNDDLVEAMESVASDYDYSFDGE